MKVKQVLTRYHKLVPFPWTPKKIKKAGYEPNQFLLDVTEELQKCDDMDQQKGAKINANLHEVLGR